MKDLEKLKDEFMDDLDKWEIDASMKSCLLVDYLDKAFQLGVKQNES